MKSLDIYNRRFVTMKQAAAFLQITHQELQHLIRSGRLATVPIGRWRVISREVLAALGPVTIQTMRDLEVLNPRGFRVRCDRCGAITSSKYGLCKDCIDV